ncbi:MAG: glycosyltransferase [Nitrospira sp. CR1.1]|jgi:glycosyltransferase involved in cell wall biosynthesis|nr:glycosyltransferase [Nitrospira sp. CR1.1]
MDASLGKSESVVPVTSPLLSVIIPTFNEISTLPLVLERVLSLPVDKEVLIVNDGSIDGTHEYLKTVAHKSVHVLEHHKNHGKGMAIRTAIGHVRGKFVSIQDADLEYAPADLLSLLRAAQERDCVVYGSRNLNKTNRISYIWYWMGAALLTYLANTLYGLALTDLWTCQKLFRTDVLKSIQLNTAGFEFEAEVTAQVAKRRIPIHEIPIRYTPRRFLDGKKIRAIDGLKASWVLFKLRFLD